MHLHLADSGSGPRTTPRPLPCRLPRHGSMARLHPPQRARLPPTQVALTELWQTLDTMVAVMLPKKEEARAPPPPPAASPPAPAAGRALLAPPSR